MQTDCYPDATTAWSKSPIRAIADINPRYRIEKDREYPFVEMASVAENFGGIKNIERRKLEGSGLSRFKVGDTLFAKITPCPENGKVALVQTLPDDVGIGSTEFIVLSPKDGCDPSFLYHLLCAHAVRGHAAARMEGSTGRQRVPDDVFENRLLVPIPSPDEQAAIARILDAADTVIERTRDALRDARTLRVSLITELLSQGIGNDGRVRDTESATDQLVSTTIGRLPTDWKLTTIANEFELQNGFTLNQARRPRNRRRRYLRVANVQRDAVDLRDIKELEASDSEFSPRVLRTDDLLVVEGHADRLQIGRCARVSEEAEGLTFQNHLFRLRAIGDVLPYFGCLWLNSVYAQRYWNARCGTSSGLNTINQRMLKRMTIPVPSKKEQELISQVVAAQRTHLEALNAKLERTFAVKNSLMHDLLAGKVRVDDISPDGILNS